MRGQTKHLAAHFSINKQQQTKNEHKYHVYSTSHETQYVDS